MTHHTFVDGAIAYYAENYYEPGNPEDGRWHDCHYPLPKCMGGNNTIKLLQHHHAIHGLLQSEYYQRPCIYGWESKLLPNTYLTLYYKWMGIKQRSSVISKYGKRGIAFELLTSMCYENNANPSQPKPVLIHYNNGTTVYAESIKHASRLTNVSQSTVQRRIKLSVQDQLSL